MIWNIAMLSKQPVYSDRICRVVVFCYNSTAWIRGKDQYLPTVNKSNTSLAYLVIPIISIEYHNKQYIIISEFLNNNILL